MPASYLPRRTASPAKWSIKDTWPLEMWLASIFFGISLEFENAKFPRRQVSVMVSYLLAASSAVALPLRF